MEARHTSRKGIQGYEWKSQNHPWILDSLRALTGRIAVYGSGTKLSGMAFTNDKFFGYHFKAILD